MTVVYWGWLTGSRRGYGLLQPPACSPAPHVSIRRSDVDSRNDVTSEDATVVRVSRDDTEEEEKVEVGGLLGTEVVLRRKPPKDAVEALDSAVFQLNARSDYSRFFVTYTNVSEAVVTRQVGNSNIPRE